MPEKETKTKYIFLVINHNIIEVYLAKTLTFLITHFYEFLARKYPEYTDIYIKWYSVTFIIVINYKHNA